MKSILHKNFYLVVLTVFVVRLFFAFFPSFAIDMNNWMAWSRMLGNVGPLKFYSLPVWTDYTPGFMYYLWVLGVIDKAVPLGTGLYPLLIKLPVILADMGIGLLLYRLVLKKGFNLAVLAFLAYTLNPVVVFTDSIWGQTDGLIALLLLLSTYFLVEKKTVVWSSFFWVLALLVKPQALVALPLLLLSLFFAGKYKQAALYILFSVSFILILGLPFFVSTHPILGLPILISKMSSESPFTSVMAFNFWAVARGMWIPDSGTAMGVSYEVWGAVLFSLAYLFIMIKLFITKNKPRHLYFLLGLGYLAFFLFPTRVHERYILVALPFFLLSACLFYTKFELLLYACLSGLALINIYHPYAYYNPDSFLSSHQLLAVTTAIYKFLAFLLVLLFFSYFFKTKLAGYFKFKVKLPQLSNNQLPVNQLPALKLTGKTEKYALLTILVFALVTRVAWLWNPPNEYFDEVYHAFTARQMLHGNPAAWEWWNTPPAGFAYEWTHPPFAKLAMWFSMAVVGESAFGWRLPGALLGVGCVYLVYLLAKKIFQDGTVGLLAAGVFSLDGLVLTMSRIGMNDSYVVFFILLTLYLFLQEKHFLSALALGLAFASKWSTVWLLPILGLIWLTRKNKLKPSYLWFMLLPFAVYLLSYVPMFTSGHTLGIFWEMQKQMWWYHTNLKATHPYQSGALSWPFLIRPVYLYTSSEVGGMVARIYNSGNPAVFWFGIASAMMAGYYAFIGKNKQLGLVLFSYLIFFVPWMASPRIMFFYHYLPAVPFMCILIAYVLRRLPKTFAFCFLTFASLLFIYFYPHWAGLNIPLWLDKSYYWFPSWR